MQHLYRQYIHLSYVLNSNRHENFLWALAYKLSGSLKFFTAVTMLAMLVLVAIWLVHPAFSLVSVALTCYKATMALALCWTVIDMLFFP